MMTKVEAVVIRERIETVIDAVEEETGHVGVTVVEAVAAARIIDQLHAAGVLGPPDGSKPRDVLVGLEDIDRICGPRN